MKHIQTLLAAVLLFSALPAMATDISFRCHGRAYEQGFFFRYTIELHDKGGSRSRLTTSNDTNSMDFGWKDIPSANAGKFAVDSPFTQYKAFIAQEGRHFNLVLVDPTTSVPIENPPYDRFACITDL